MFVPNISEAAAVRLIETILFGGPLRPPTPAPLIKRRPRRSPCAPPSAPANPFAASNAEFFRSIVLRQRAAPAPPPPVTPISAALPPPFRPNAPAPPLRHPFPPP